MYLKQIEESSEWGKEYPEANGHHQSPIDFVSNDAIFDESLLERALSVSYCTSRETDIVNDGQTLIVYPKNKGGKPCMTIMCQNTKWVERFLKRELRIWYHDFLE